MNRYGTLPRQPQHSPQKFSIFFSSFAFCHVLLTASSMRWSMQPIQVAQVVHLSPSGGHTHACDFKEGRCPTTVSRVWRRYCDTTRQALIWGELSRVIEGFNPAAGGETEGATRALEKWPPADYSCVFLTKLSEIEGGIKACTHSPLTFVQEHVILFLYFWALYI